MYTLERIIVLLSILWAATALVYQWLKARGKGRIDYSRKAGDVVGGIFYNFTWAMLPAHKETIRLHPYLFTVGLLMHVGILLTIAYTVLIAVFPHIKAPSLVSSPILIISILCGLFLLFRRILSVQLRSMSSFEDYFSIIMTLYFLAAAFAHENGTINTGIYLINASILYIYLPLGKLRHALFFFIARADYGARLGYRGTYPVRSEVKE